jgi:hypothetical protein
VFFVMANGASVTTVGKNLALARLFNSTNTVVSQFKIGTGTTTPAVTDVDLTTPVTAWHSATDFGEWVSGYPTFDLVNSKVTVKGYVASTEANGNTLSETGLFNSDGTPVMFSHDVHTAFSKTSTVEAIYTWVFQIVDV